MPDTFAEPDLPIVAEIGVALYAASVAADAQPRRRRRPGEVLGRHTRRLLAAGIVFVGLGASAGGLALAGTFTAAQDTNLSKICSSLRHGHQVTRPAHLGFVVACPVSRPGRPPPQHERVLTKVGSTEPRGH